ncbi:MAG: YraN family protein [Candidatus Omnitrophica bacterium]|nr:YraN family protein [Candidatus Omnitrophota bacterium]
MDKYKQALGKRGERLAVQFLRRQGYRILARNFSCRLGEIDLIAQEKDTTVFIEVKTRASCEFGLPQAAIRQKKIKHLRRTAQYYIKHNAHSDDNFRFDVVAIVLEDLPKIELIKNAF